MIQLPTVDDLAALVSNVTQTMLGLSFVRVNREPDRAQMWRMAVLPISGSSPVLVGMASDQLSGTVLGSKMFQLPLSSVDPSIVEDTLCELVNITAGRLKSSMSLDQALGLPKVFRSDLPLVENGKEGARQVVLRGGDVELVFQVTTT